MATGSLMFEQLGVIGCGLMGGSFALAMSPFEGKTMEFKVIKLDRKRNNVVLSRRAVVEASMGEERAKLMETLREGAIVHGVVKNITEYGAFVDLGGIDGLLHITDMNFLKKPSSASGAWPTRMPLRRRMS